MIYFNMLLSSILFENIVLNNFLGLNEFRLKNIKLKKIILLSLPISLLLSLLFHLIYSNLLSGDLFFLRTITIVLLLIAIVNIGEFIFKKTSTNMIDYYQYLITSTVIVGIPLLSVLKEYNLIETLIFTLGSNLGFYLLLYLYSTLSKKIENAGSLKSFHGIPMLLIFGAIISILIKRYM